jgi:hypothetical protein
MIFTPYFIHILVRVIFPQMFQVMFPIGLNESLLGS